MNSATKIFIVSFFLYFFSWVLIYNLKINTLAIQSEDSLPAMFLPVAIIKDHTFYLDRYYGMMTQRYPHPDDKNYLLGLTPFYLKKVGNHYLSAFPVMTAFLATLVYFGPVTFGMPITWENLIFLSHVASALIVALSGGLLFLLLRKHFNLGLKKSYLVCAIYLFGTINYALASQALWQHGSVQLFLILTIYFWMEVQKRPLAKNFFLYGLFSGLSILSRPTALLPVFLTAAYLIFFSRKKLREIAKPTSTFMLGILICLAFFVWYNKTYYIDLSNQGYSSQLVTNWLSPFPVSFLGVWFSPSKGLLIYSPVFIFSIIGSAIALRKKDYKYLVFGLIVFLHTLVISFWKHWYGGWSFGYRMSSDIIPFLVLMLIPFLESNYFYKFRYLFIASVAFSVLVEVFGIVFFDGIWHAAYDQGFKNTSWLWSIKDSELMFDIRRVLVKLGYLQRACPKCF